MTTKRIIPCLDIKNGRTVKGVNFINLIDAGDPVELAQKYEDQGADELVFLDISATLEERKTTLEMVTKIAEQISIPFTVGGGITSVEDAHLVLKAGADKIAMNSSAVKKPDLINELAKNFGRKSILIAIDAKQIDGEWMVYTSGGNISAALNLFDWAKEVENRGAGEILFTSMDHDGTKNGFPIEALKRLATNSNIPIIASGGAGTIEHFIDAFQIGQCDAALAASVFHFGEINIKDLKTTLKNNNIDVKI